MSKEFIGEGPKSRQIVSSDPIVQFHELDALRQLKHDISKKINVYHIEVVANTFRSAAKAGWLTEEALTILRQAGIVDG